MTKPSILLAAGALTMVGSVGLASAETVTLHSGYRKEGVWQEVGDGQMFWSGTYWLFSFSEAGGGFGDRMASTCPATVMVADGIARYSGFCIKTDADGDQLFSSFEGELPRDAPFAGAEVYVGGTGKYQDIRGDAEFNCSAIGRDEQGYCDYRVNYTLP